VSSPNDRPHLILGRSPTDATVVLQSPSASRVHALVTAPDFPMDPVRFHFVSRLHTCKKPCCSSGDNFWQIVSHKDDGLIYVIDLRSAHGTHIDNKKIQVRIWHPDAEDASQKRGQLFYYDMQLSSLDFCMIL
jgi:hypothetical protein